MTRSFPFPRGGLPRRRLLAGAAAAAATAALAPAAALAQAGAAGRPVNLVVTYAPGGPTDAMARTLAQALGPLLGQPVVVDNRPGAGGNIGADHVARAAPDGSVLMFGTSAPLAINASLYRNLNYDPIKSFAPVIHLGYLPNVLVVHPSLPVHNVPELVAHAKAHPDKLSYASSGSGASSHLAGVLFNMRMGTDIAHIPYKGTGPALNDLLGGQVSMSFTDVLTALPHIQAGKLRVLGVTTAQRSRALPDVPSLQEQGVADYDVSVFFAVVAPAGTPAATVGRLNQAFIEALAQPKVRQTLDAQGLELAADPSPAALGAFMAREVAQWRTVVQASGARVD